MFKRPSAALVVAVVALFASLSGVGFAAQGLITGAQIKDHSIGMVDLSNLAIAKLQGRPGPVGPAGPQGPAGGFDPSKVTYVQSSPYTVAPFAVTNQAVAMTATCAPGTKVIAGGSYHNIALVGANLATPDGSGWSVIVVNTTPITLEGLYAFAVCAAR